MKLYLVDADKIYFPQIKDYFREIVSSYDNQNYRSAVVMLYSTIVCDLLLKLKELSELYSDKKAEKILQDIEKQRKNHDKSKWEWDLITRLHNETELLNDESYTMIQHIYDLRNFSAHPALTDDYELVSPSPELTVAYIKKALEDVFIKPSVFAQSIVDHMSDDLAAKKEVYKSDPEALKNYLYKAYFQRMSEKMICQVFKAFWKFTLRSAEGDQFKDNRVINRKVLEYLLDYYESLICGYISTNANYFQVAQDKMCLNHACALLSFFPRVYQCLDSDVKYQIEKHDKDECTLLKWFIDGDLENYYTTINYGKDCISKSMLEGIRKICQAQGQPRLFFSFLIRHYGQSSNFTSARNRFDCIIEPYLESFNKEECQELIETINRNSQIYNYMGQRNRNDKLLNVALPLLGESFDLSEYKNIRYSKPQASDETEDEPDPVFEDDGIPDNDPALPF